MRLLFLAMVAVALGGCATKQYYHTSITNKDDVERQRVIDDALCTEVSMGLIEMPQIVHQSSGSYRHSGTISSGRDTYTYSGRSRPSAADSFSAGFANGMNIGNAIVAQRAREKLYHACMLTKGWSDDQAKATETAKRKQEADTDAKLWQDTVDQFLATEAARPGGINYKTDSFRMMQLDITVKELAKNQKNDGKSMLWYLVEADRIVKEFVAQEKSFFGK